MELWLILTLICAILASVAGFFDNSLVDNYFNTKHPQVQKCFFGPFYAVVAILIFIFYPIFLESSLFSASSALLVALSGVILSLSSIPYYFALKSENTTGAIIFLQLEPIFLLVFGFLFLNESISLVQAVAFLILLSAPLLIILSARKRGKKLEYRAGLFLLIHLFLYTVSYTIFVIAERGASSSGGELPMAMTIAFLLSGRALIDLILILFFRKWRKGYKHVLKKSKYRVLVPLFASAILWTAEDIIFRNALVIGQVAVVSAIETVVKLLATFLLGLVFTIVWPKFGREDLNRRTVIVHFIATLIAIFGIVLVENPEIFGG